MKNYLCILVLLLCGIGAVAQNKNNKLSLAIGGSIQHYNGNLGNSFFKFNSVCFGGATATFGIYINKSFDFNLGGYVGHYGYHPPHVDGEEVPLEHRCPGCDGLGMGNLSSLMISGNMAIKYKFANDILLKENAKLAPYAYAGMGINHLSDDMKKQCVNAGYHFSINGGVGVRYNISERFNIGYNLGLGCFAFGKVYNTNLSSGLVDDTIHKDSDYYKMERRKDLYMQNSLSLGVNF